MAKRWMDEPWATDPRIILSELSKTYQKALEIKKIESVAKTTMKKVMADRGWGMWVREEALLDAIAELGVVYLPAGIEPGPGFLFPIRDVTGEIKRAHIRLINGEKIEFYGGKYLSLVDKHLFIGPPWLGTDEATLEAIIQTGEVTVMEGPFDLLAIRTVAPSLPSLCSLTKRLGKLHWTYLKILGVRKVYVMFDEEKSGRGAQAAEIMVQKHRDFEIVPLTCPAKDPADALKTSTHTATLRKLLKNITPESPTLTTSLFDEED